ncbi:MAG: zinc ribbon domain-containing protein [Gammaproteobacteria bacterium]|nr:zinc ribbon domain-containing protein [Gammaproteobacteria bacterium]MDH5591244.1 zinc ribbon domain-containing protein [Gammaproteobacteria bacterium]
MPLYEYRCEKCEHEFEALQKMSDEPLIHCPACEKASLKKLVSAAGFRLKGDGWYETDFKSGNKRNLVDSGVDSSAKKPKMATCTTGCGCH